MVCECVRPVQCGTSPLVTQVCCLPAWWQVCVLVCVYTVLCTFWWLQMSLRSPVCVYLCVCVSVFESLLLPSGSSRVPDPISCCCWQRDIQARGSAEADTAWRSFLSLPPATHLICHCFDSRVFFVVCQAVIQSFWTTRSGPESKREPQPGGGLHSERETVTRLCFWSPCTYCFLKQLLFIWRFCFFP